jgi:hypothetical protein
MVRLLLAALVLHTLAALVLHTSALNAAENLDAAPIGTAVTGSFLLGGKLIPLPEGSYRLAAKGIEQPVMMGSGDVTKRPSIARVLLVQIKPPRLRAAVYASVSLTPTSYRYNWVGNPCKKEDTLYRGDLSSTVDSESDNCLQVDYVLGSFSPRSQGIWKDASAWLTEQQVQVPVPPLIVAQVTRTERWQLVSAVYAFNPRMHGCEVPRTTSRADSPWNKKSLADDPERVRFVDSVIEFGKAMQQHFDNLLTGRPSSIDKVPSIYHCGPARLALGDTP